MKAYFEMKTLIAAEYHILVPDEMPLYEIQYMASMAENRRNDRIKAAEQGRQYIG
jgi:hypothetical protein